MYKKLLTTPEALAEHVESGNVVCADITLSQPKGILDAVAQHVKDAGLKDVKQHTVLDVYPYAMYQNADMLGSLTGISWFSSGGARKAMGAAARQYAAGRSWSVVADRTLAIYEQALAAR